MKKKQKYGFRIGSKVVYNSEIWFIKDISELCLYLVSNVDSEDVQVVQKAEVKHYRGERKSKVKKLKVKSEREEEAKPNNLYASWTTSASALPELPEINFYKVTTIQVVTDTFENVEARAFKAHEEGCIVTFEQV